MPLDRGDRYKALSLVVGFILWWTFIGSHKYSVKGMTKRG